ncbi:Lectin C-type domain [Seminavis robusta]|uniref:Lectin C-type domain n=1 Tax=Seminavis robusta TaxID=568900 RepID=A0A9N8E4K2_9STRA|nr:Lectin C-type domain [Seminavis robusta]|eukprot:Sro660_g182920.1 Lectin C-type domain (469) ;mRNA; f:3693-5502
MSYTLIQDTFGNGVQAFADRDNQYGRVSGEAMCEGGRYLQPLEYKHARRGSKIVLKATPKAGKQVTVCAFLKVAHRGVGWDDTLLQSGFSESGDFRIVYETGGIILMSYCKVITGDEVAAPLPESVCASGTLATNGHFYEVAQYVRGTMTWHEAKATAEAKTHCGKSGHLVTITSKGESDHVNGLISAETCPREERAILQTWIGLTDAEEYGYKEGTIGWVTGEPFEFENWCPGEPNASGRSHDFAEINFSTSYGACWDDAAGQENVGDSNDKYAKEWLWFNGKEVTSDLPAGTWGRQQLGGFLVRYKESTVRAGLIRDADIYFVGSKEKLIFKAFKSFIRIDVDWKHSENYKNAVGLLGSYSHQGERLGRDGQFIKDTNTFGLDWQVIPETDGSLFHSYEGAVVNQKCIMPASYEGSTALRGRRLGTSSVDEGVAEKACNHLLDPDEKKACVFDVVATQDLSLASTW